MTDYKQLCAELVNDLELCDWPYKIKETIRSDIDRARAALAEPEPEGPTDKKLDLLADCYMITDGETGAVSLEHLDYARAVLARWGNYPGSPDSSTLQPVPVSERLPEPTDEPMIPDHYRGDDIRVYREGFHAGYKYAFQLIEKHSDV